MTIGIVSFKYTLWNLWRQPIRWEVLFIYRTMEFRLSSILSFVRSHNKVLQNHSCRQFLFVIYIAYICRWRGGQIKVIYWSGGLRVVLYLLHVQPVVLFHAENRQRLSCQYNNFSRSDVDGVASLLQHTWNTCAGTYWWLVETILIAKIPPCHFVDYGLALTPFWRQFFQVLVEKKFFGKQTPKQKKTLSKI